MEDLICCIKELAVVVVVSFSILFFFLILGWIANSKLGERLGFDEGHVFSIGLYSTYAFVLWCCLCHI